MPITDRSTENFRDIFNAVRAARSGGAVADEAAQGALAAKQAAFKQQLEAAGIVSGANINAAAAGQPQPEDQQFSAPAVGALAHAELMPAQLSLMGQRGAALTKNADSAATKASAATTNAQTAQAALDEKIRANQASEAIRQTMATDKAAGLTMANKSRSQLAQSTLPLLDAYDTLVETADKKGLLGPAAGRYYTALDKVGTTGDPETDNLLGELRGAQTFLASKLNVMHYGARGTHESMQKFMDVTDPGHKSLDLIRGGLAAERTFVHSYIHDGGSPAPEPAAATTPAQPAVTPNVAPPPHPQDDAARKWATDNPNDPRSKAILDTLNGGAQ